MPILHVITKTASGYALRVWEPAETTADRVRPFLWEINLNAASVDVESLQRPIEWGFGIGSVTATEETRWPRAYSNCAAKT